MGGFSRSPLSMEDMSESPPFPPTPPNVTCCLRPSSQHMQGPRAPDLESLPGSPLLAAAARFSSAVLSSPLLKSALTVLELRGAWPETHLRDAGHIASTLAAMLALYVRGGLHAMQNDDAATSDVLLATLLWTLEAWSDVWRSPASLVLRDYLHCLPLFQSTDATPDVVHLREAMLEQQVRLLLVCWLGGVWRGPGRPFGVGQVRGVRARRGEMLWVDGWREATLQVLAA